MAEYCPLLTRVKNMYNLYKDCEEENRKLKGNDLIYAAMRADEKFPEFSDSQRLTFDNVKVGDIIRCLVWKRPLYAVVKRITKSGVGVDDLSLNMNGVKVEFYRKHEVNSTHKGTLNYGRKISLISRDQYIVINPIE